jgi:secondary thiamine-phosphate synthase enzyme
MAQSFTVKTRERTGCVDVTAQVAEIVRASGVRAGLCHVMALHATAAIVINENDDPNIGVDLLAALARMVPDGPGWLHDRIDDNATAHLKAAILGPQETLAIEDGRLLLGRWQAIMLVELDGPRERRISVQVVGQAGG